MRILFVCYANLCRSAMAEAIGRSLASRRDLPDPVILRSAGLRATPGAAVPGEAVSTAAELGGDLSGHEATPFAPDLAEWADCVVAMTHAQKAEILHRVPAVRPFVYTLAELVRELSGRRPGFRDVQDPIGGTAEDFRRCARLLHDALETMLDALAGTPPPPRRSRLSRVVGWLGG